MTVREWFRTLRREGDAHGLGDDAYRGLLVGLRAGDWRMAEFWWLLLRSSLEAWVIGQHVWEPSADGYWWTCALCGAQVGRDIDDEAPDPLLFEVDCACRACRPCEGSERCHES